MDTTHSTSRRVRRVFWALIAAAGLLEASAAETWTLERAVRIALTNNPDARLARHRIAAAQAGVQQANAALWPLLQVNAGYVRTDNPMMVFGSALNQQRFSFGLDFNDVPDADNLNLNGQILVPLYRGGQTGSARKQAAARTRAEEHAGEAVRQALALEVTRTFLQVQKAGAFIQASEAAVGAFESNLAIAQKRHAIGNALKQDVLDVEVRLAQAREDLVRTRNAQALALHALRNLIALEADAELTVAPEVPSLPEPAANTAIARAEVLAVARQREAAEAGVRQAQGGYLPRVDAFGRYDYDHGWKFNGSGDSYAAGVQLQWNLWDGQLTRGRVREARAALEAAEEQERKLQLAIQLEVQQARLNLREAVERLSVSDKSVQQASESAQLTHARFEQGLALATQVIDAETALTSARVRRAEAESDRLVAIASLRRALGLYPIELPQP